MGEKQGNTPLAGHLRVHPEYMDQAWETKGGLGPPQTSLRSMDQHHLVHRRPQAMDHSPIRAHGRDVAASQRATCLAQPGPDRPNPKPNRPSSDPARIDR